MKLGVKSSLLKSRSLIPWIALFIFICFIFCKLLSFADTENIFVLPYRSEFGKKYLIFVLCMWICWKTIIFPARFQVGVFVAVSGKFILLQSIALLLMHNHSRILNYTHVAFKLGMQSCVRDIPHNKIITAKWIQCVCVWIHSIYSVSVVLSKYICSTVGARDLFATHTIHLTNMCDEMKSNNEFIVRYARLCFVQFQNVRVNAMSISWVSLCYESHFFFFLFSFLRKYSFNQSFSLGCLVAENVLKCSSHSVMTLFL